MIIPPRSAWKLLSLSFPSFLFQHHQRVERLILVASYIHQDVAAVKNQPVNCTSLSLYLLWLLSSGLFVSPPPSLYTPCARLFALSLQCALSLSSPSSACERVRLNPPFFRLIPFSLSHSLVGVHARERGLLPLPIFVRHCERSWLPPPSPFSHFNFVSLSLSLTSN